MSKSAMGFIAGGVLVFAVTAIWATTSEFQRREEERRVMDFLTAPASKSFETITKE